MTKKIKKIRYNYNINTFTFLRTLHRFVFAFAPSIGQCSAKVNTNKENRIYDYIY